MNSKIRTITDNLELRAQLEKLYVTFGATISSNGSYVLPAATDAAIADVLNEKAFSLLHSGNVKKRVMGKPDVKQSDHLDLAYKLFRKAASLNIGLTAETFNFGCCCYHIGDIENGLVCFNLIFDQKHQGVENYESEKVFQHLVRFYNYVVTDLRAWYNADELVNPNFFMSRRIPSTLPVWPQRHDFDPNVLI